MKKLAKAYEVVSMPLDFFFAANHCNLFNFYILCLVTFAKQRHISLCVFTRPAEDYRVNDITFAGITNIFCGIAAFHSDEMSALFHLGGGQFFTGELLKNQGINGPRECLFRGS